MTSTEISHRKNKHVLPALVISYENLRICCPQNAVLYNLPRIAYIEEKCTHDTMTQGKFCLPCLDCVDAMHSCLSEAEANSPMCWASVLEHIAYVPGFLWHWKFSGQACTDENSFELLVHYPCWLRTAPIYTRSFQYDQNDLAIESLKCLQTWRDQLNGWTITLSSATLMWGLLL